MLHDRRGFTLIELLVVVFLFSLLAFFSFPRLAGFFPRNDKDDIARWLIMQTSILRTRTVKQQTSYVLQVDIDANQFQVMAAEQAGVEDPDSDPESASPSFPPASRAAGSNALLKLTEETKIAAVVFAGSPPINSGTVDIYFHTSGYSDRAMIQMRAGRERFSFYIAPFLPTVKIYEGYTGFKEDLE